MDTGRLNNEEELLLRLNRGEEPSLRMIFDIYNLALVHFAKQITKDKAQAEDAVTDAFIMLWKKRADFHSLQAIRSFLYQAAKNSCLNWLEHRKVVTKNQPGLSAMLSIEDNDLENHAMQAELIRLLYQEITRLPQQYSELIKLLFIDGLNHEDAAVALGITEANLRMRKSRAIEQLRARLIRKGFFIFFLKIAVAKPSLSCLTY